MRLTQALLQEYLEAEIMIKKLEAKKAEIREAIIERKEPEFSMGDFLVKATECARVIAMPVKQIIDEIGEKEAAKILRETKSVRVEVRRVS